MNPDVEWSTREKLAIASYVSHTGDQHWTGKVSRLLRPLGDPDRPPDWFSTKNCAQQYTALLEAAEKSRRKKTERSNSNESITGSSTLQVPTPSLNEIALRKATQDRMEELKKLIRIERSKYKKIYQTIEQLESGEANEKIDEMYEEFKQQKLEPDLGHPISCLETSENLDTPDKPDHLFKPVNTELNKQEEVDETSGETADETKLVEPIVKPTEETLHSNESEIQEEPVQTNEDNEDSVDPKVLVQSPLMEKEDTVSSVTSSSRTLPTPTPVIDSDSCDEEELSGIEKDFDPIETCQNDEVESVDINNSVSSDQKSLDIDTQNSQEDLSQDQSGSNKRENTERSVFETLSACDPVLDKKTFPLASDSAKDKTDDVFKNPNDRNIFEQIEKASQSGFLEPTKTNKANISSISDPRSVDVAEVPTIDDGHSEAENKDDISGEVIDQETDKLKSDSRLDDNSQVSFTSESTEITDDNLKLSTIEDDRQDGVSENMVVTEDESKTEDESIDYGSNASSSTAYTETFPNSPALSNTSDADPELTAQSRAWKKSIMILWKQVASHKYASLFLHPVTNDIAPNYSSIVLRPMDLSMLKKNVENGLVRTTSEFQRDLMLMFQNALMYNNCEHDVYKMTEEMQKDVMDQVGLMVETTKQTSTKGLRRSTLRKSVATEKGSDTRSKRQVENEVKKK